MEAALFIWSLNACPKGVLVSGPILAQQARDLTFVLKHDFMSGTCWLQRLKDRHSITRKSISGEAASVDNTLLQAWLDKNLNRISTTYADCDIYNAHESRPFFYLLPAKTLTLKDDRYVRTKTSKERVPVLVRVNINGSDKRKLLVIGKYHKP